MTWYVRLKENAEVYKPRECPIYTADGYFSIKLIHGGEMRFDPKCYVNGSVDYVDECCEDEMSLIEINSMMKEVDELGGFHRYWYRLPGTDMERGCFELDSDDELMTMCQLLGNRDKKLDRYVEVFVQVIRPISSQNDIDTENVDVEYVEANPRQHDCGGKIGTQSYPTQEEAPMYDDMFFNSTQDEVRTEESKLEDQRKKGTTKMMFPLPQTLPN